jgi:hypothetical protein
MNTNKKTIVGFFLSAAPVSMTTVYVIKVLFNIITNLN